MRASESIFTRKERLTALGMLLAAALVAAAGLTAEQWSRPSVGPYGNAAYAFAPSPGVLDAQPALDAVGRFNGA